MNFPRSLSMAQDDDPRAPYKVYEGDELKGTYATRALKRGDGNSNSKASKQPAQNHNVISSLGTTSTASSFDWAASLPLRPQVNEPDNGG
jgi:hypothetical protein